MYKNKILQILLFLVILTTYYLLHTTVQARAQTPTRTTTVTPPNVEVLLSPGNRTEGTMGVINDSDEAVTYTVTVQDFTVEDTHGTPNILPPNTLSNKFSAASWIGVTPDTFTVAPHKRQNLNYYIQLPSTARPGGHYAAVIYTPAVPKDQTGSGASVYATIGTLFYIDVKGPITESATVAKFTGNSFQEYGPLAILTEITNNGDLHIKPAMSITVKNMVGQTVYSGPILSQNIFPGKARDFVTLISSKWMVGRFTATLFGYYGKGNNLPLMASFSFVIFPWKIALIITLVIIAIILGLLLWKKKKQEDKMLNEETSQE